MKSFLIGLFGVFCSITWVHGDPAGDLYAKGNDAMKAGDYAGAVQAFDQVITNYPSTSTIDEIRLRAGFAYLHMGDYAKAVERLAPETLKTAKPEYRGSALYYTALAQLTQASKETDKTARAKELAQAVATFTDLVNYVPTSTNAEDKDYLEDALYNRAIANFQREDYASAEKDLLRLTSSEFSSSLRRPDFFVMLGNLYFAQAVNTHNAAKPTDSPEPVKTLAGKALDAFNTVSTDPNALVQANEANLRKAEVLYFLAPLDLPSTDGYQKAFDAFRTIHRKDDLIPLQEARLKQLTAEQQARAQAAPSAALGGNSLLLEREKSRLKDLQAGVDPIIEALIRIAECYNSIKQADEARTVLHRLAAHAKLTDDQQKEVDFQVLYSYVLGGQTEKANQALTDYLNKHKGDPQADSISYQMAADLLHRKDFAGALSQADRSLNDFPNGRFVAEAVLLKANALTGMGKPDESKKVIDEFAAKNPKSPVALQMLVTNAQNQLAQGKPEEALADYKKVKESGAEGELPALAAAGYIQTLQQLGRTGEIIAESKAFATKFPNSKALPGVLVLGGIAMDQKKDPGAVAALQEAARKFPGDESSGFALYYVVDIYRRQGLTDKMLEAAKELATAYPASYALLAQVADAVSAAYVKQKKFDLAIAQFDPLLKAPKPEVVADAQNKVGALWVAAAKGLGSYQSMQKEEDRAEALKRLASAEQSYLLTLKNEPAQLGAVGDAFQGLIEIGLLRRSWGLLTDKNFEDDLAKVTADLTSPEMQARVELAKAGLVFVTKDGAKQYPEALARFKKTIDANPSLALTRQEANQFGELLIDGKDYARALTVFNNLLSQAAPSDQLTLADAYYGLGATYLAQDDVDNAKKYFDLMKRLNQGAIWHPRILQANMGIARAAEKSGDSVTAKSIYASIMRAPQAAPILQARAMLGYGRILERNGAIVKKPGQQDIEYAINYYEQVDNLFGPALPALSAEGLLNAAQAYAKAGDKAKARADYQKLIDGYGKTAPDAAAKAQDEMAKLGP